MDLEKLIINSLQNKSEQVDITPALWDRIRISMQAPGNQLSEQSGRKILGRELPGFRSKAFMMAGVLALLLLSAIVIVSTTRSALAQWLNITFDRIESPNRVVQQVAARRPLSAANSYEYILYELPKERWDLLQAFNILKPLPGEPIPLPNGGQLSVPAYLPEGFEWQDVIITSSTMRDRGFPSLGSSSAGGGGLQPLPDFDRSFATFLIGGDPADRFLVLAQFENISDPGLSIRTFFTISPDRPFSQLLDRMESGLSSSNAPRSDAVPTPTPVPQSYQAKLQIGIVIEASPSSSGISLMVGSDHMSEVRLGENQGWWYQGAWDLEGNWIENKNIINLVWVQEEHIYQLIGEDIDTDTLISIAESAYSTEAH
jgi:hypothetical protein